MGVINATFIFDHKFDHQLVTKLSIEGVPYSRLEWPSQMLDWPALLGCLELADMADIGWVGKVPSF